MRKKPKTPLTPEEEHQLLVRVHAAVDHFQQFWTSPQMNEAREAGQRLQASYQAMENTIVELEQVLLVRHPEKSASVVLGPGLKLHYNDEGLSIEISEPGRPYNVRPLKDVSRNRKMLALSKAPQLIEQLGE